MVRAFPQDCSIESAKCCDISGQSQIRVCHSDFYDSFLFRPWKRFIHVFIFESLGFEVRKFASDQQGNERETLGDKCSIIKGMDKFSKLIVVALLQLSIAFIFHGLSHVFLYERFLDDTDKSFILDFK